MSPLASEIERGGITGTPEEVALAFTGTVPHMIDQEPYDWARLIDRLIGLGASAIDAYGLRDVLEQDKPNGAILCRMLDKGVKLSLDQIQQLINEIIKAQPDGNAKALLTLVKEAGVKHGTYWSKLGLPGEPTANDVTAAKEEIKAFAFVRELTEPGGPLHEVQIRGKTVAQVKAALAAAVLKVVPDVAK